jgi:hypothetical protein
VQPLTDHRRANCEPGEIQLQYLKPGQRFKLNLAPYAERIGTLESVQQGRCIVSWQKTEVRKVRTRDGREIEFMVSTASDSCACETPVISLEDSPLTRAQARELDARLRALEGKK